jgi:hypothetical protein
MLVTDHTRRALAYRRQKKQLLAEGYEYVSEPIWELHRGARWRERIVDVKISTDGQSLYVKTAEA